jgi:hypothetical protein
LIFSYLFAVSKVLNSWEIGVASAAVIDLEVIGAVAEADPDAGNEVEIDAEVVCAVLIAENIAKGSTHDKKHFMVARSRRWWRFDDSVLQTK